MSKKLIVSLGHHHLYSCPLPYLSLPSVSPSVILIYAQKNVIPLNVSLVFGYEPTLRLGKIDDQSIPSLWDLHKS